VGARFSTPAQTGPGATPASCTMGTGSFPGIKSGWGVTLTPHPLLVPWSRNGKALPLPPLWAIWPVQSLSACTRVHFTLLCVFMGQDSSVGTVTHYGLDGPGIETWWGRDFPHPSRLALGPTQPPIQGAQGFCWG
jgi:hypothetical protein